MQVLLFASMFGNSQPVLLSFPLERPVFLREYSSNTYSAIWYFISKLIVELPLTLVQVSVSTFIAYYFMGLHAEVFLLIMSLWLLAI